jgi:uncharacterized protein
MSIPAPSSSFLRRKSRVRQPDRDGCHIATRRARDRRDAVRVQRARSVWGGGFADLLQGVGILTDDMKRVVREQRLGFYATANEDGSPNLSPKGSTYVLDDDHLFFADIRSPQTVANVRAGSLVEVNVVDPLVRKGYRFKGSAEIHEPGSSVYATATDQMRDAGSQLVERAKAIVVIEVREARPLTSPVYDDGSVTEAEVISAHRARMGGLKP